MSWYSICSFDSLPIDRGVCALVDGAQVAVVRTHDGSLYAVDNLDPFSGAMVMARGIVGSRGTRDVLMSPMHKQAYDLDTGQCLEEPEIWLAVHHVRVVDGMVEVGLAGAIRQLA
jgi:nitrite reductase (NADH) small subunit